MKKQALSTLPSSSRDTSPSSTGQLSDFIDTFDAFELIVSRSNIQKTCVIIMGKILEKTLSNADKVSLPMLYDTMLAPTAAKESNIENLEALALFLRSAPCEHWEIIKNIPSIAALIEQRRLAFQALKHLKPSQHVTKAMITLHEDLARALIIAAHHAWGSKKQDILFKFCEFISSIIKDLPLSSFTWRYLVAYCASSKQIADLLNNKCFDDAPGDFKTIIVGIARAISERFCFFGLRRLISYSQHKLDIATYVSWVNHLDNHFMLRDEIVKALALDGSEEAYVSMRNQLMAMDKRTIQGFILSLEPNNQFNLAKQWHKIMPALPTSSQSNQADTSALCYEDRFVIETSHLPPLPQDLTHAGLWAHMLEMYHLDLPPSTSKAREIDTEGVAALVSGSDRIDRVLKNNDLFEIYVLVSGNRLGLAENYQYEQVDISESRLYAYLYQLEQHFQQLTNCQFHVRKKEGEGELFDGVCTGKYIDEQRILIVGGFQFNISPRIRIPLSYALSPSASKYCPHATAPSSSMDKSQPSQGGYFARTGVKKSTSLETKPLPNTMSLQM